MSTASPGLVYDASAPDFQDRLADVYRTMRDDHPVCRDPEGWYALTRFDDVRAALQDQQRFSSDCDEARMVGSFINFLDPPRHGQMRGLVSRAFTPRRVAEREERVREIARALLDGLDPHGCDLLEEYAAVLPSQVIGEMIGLPDELLEPFRECTEAFIPGAGEDVIATSVFTMIAMYQELLADRRREPRDDLMSALLAAEVDGVRLTEEEVLSFCLVLVLGGNDTTRTLIGNGVELLARHPDQRAALVADPSRIPGAVEEMLRIAAPVQALARTTTCDVPLHGTTIPAGSRVMVVFGAANLDEREFADPERFDIDRPVGRHLALGHGAHFCIGAQLARQEARIAFEELLARHPDYELDGAPVRLRSAWARTFESVPVVLRPEVPA